MRRIGNYRKGDRAEKMGVVLLQAFCAVAEIPRQEDFGLADAVATLIRREGRFLVAEDSFLVQIKSRTERKIEFFGLRFEALLSQDLSLFIAQVDLTKASIDLYSLGADLAHPNFSDLSGLVVYLRPPTGCPSGVVNGVFHVPLATPALTWTIENVEQSGFQDLSYRVLKAWLIIERWNRRYRAAGITRQINWKTNEVPREGAEIQIWNPARGTDLLKETIPVVRILASHGSSHPELRAPIQSIVSWLRGRGVDADPARAYELMIRSAEAQELLEAAIKEHPRFNLAMIFYVDFASSEHLDFWSFSRNNDGVGGGKKHSGSIDLLRSEGYLIEFVGGQTTVNLGFSPSWLEENGFDDAMVVDPETNRDAGTKRSIMMLHKRFPPPS